MKSKKREKSWDEMLKDLCVKADKLAKQEDWGSVYHTLFTIDEKSQCIQAQFVDNKEEYPVYSLFANSDHKGENIIRIEDDENQSGRHQTIGDNPRTLLSVLRE